MKTLSSVVFSLLLLIASTCFAANNSFMDKPETKAFIDRMVAQHHFSKDELTALIASIPERKKIIHSMKHSAENTHPWMSYKKIFITDKRIHEGLAFWQQHLALLNQAEVKYDIPKKIMVATLGVETNYFKNQGDYPVIDALVNLAFNYPSRSKFFTYQLEQYLLLCQEQDFDPKKVLGSYAGAIGAPQFMPDSFRNYAVDFSKSGKIDLIADKADVIGSIANYYKQHGWKTGGGIIIPASFHGEKPLSLKTNNRLKLYSPKELSDAGIIPSSTIPKDETMLMLMKVLEEDGDHYYLGLKNFQVILKYNSSYLYGLAVYTLGNEISDRL